MKSNAHLRIALLLLILFSMTFTAFSQKKGKEQHIISNKVNIDKYHDREELQDLNKGKLLDLYIQRIDVIIKILPNIAFTTKPGVTMSDLGIPDTKQHRSALADNIEATAAYFDDTLEFQNLVLPYSDKSSLVSAILFYEQTLKSLHTYNDFN